MPLPNEHTCVLTDGDQYESFRRVNNDRKSDGKSIDVIYGIKKQGKKKVSEEHSYHYPSKQWTEKQARKH